MLRSMTGFGRGNFIVGQREYLCEIRTINHRYCDISIKMPRIYSCLENKIREVINQKIARGKVEVSIWVEDYGTEGRRVQLDEGLVDLYMEAFSLLKQKYNLNDEINLLLISRMPDIFTIKYEKDEDTVWKEMKQAVDQAIDNLIKMREEEGERLKKDLVEKIATLKKLVNQIEIRAPMVVEDYRNRLQSRIKEILVDFPAEEGRLELEVAIFAERCNIDEELVRLKSHIEQMYKTLEMEQPVGRKLDFLIQEMNREINTIGSKANNLEITKIVVEVKSEIEKIREQIQNLE